MQSYVSSYNLQTFTTSPTEQSIKSNAVAFWNKYVNDKEEEWGNVIHKSLCKYLWKQNISV